MCEPSPSDRAAAAVSRAGEWLSSLVEARIDDLDEQGLCLGLFGISCVAKALPRNGSPSTDTPTAEMILARLTAGPRGAESLRASFARGGFVTPLMAAAALAVDSPAAARYRQLCLEEWAALERSPWPDDSRVALFTGRLLAKLIVGEAPEPLGSLGALSHLNRLARYTARPQGIHAVIRELAVRSAFGQLEVVLNEGEREILTDALSFWTFFHLKERDLDLVCPLVRALGYLRLNDLPEYGQGVEFIIRQGKSSGRFGMQEMATHLKSLATQERSDTERELQLPLTVASVWALLESHCFAAMPFRRLPARCGQAT